MARQVSSVLILTGSVTGAGEAHQPVNERRTFQAVGATSAGAGSAIVDIQGSLDGVNWITIATITLVLAVTVATDGFASDAAWRYVRANCTTLTGTNASVQVYMGA